MIPAKKQRNIHPDGFLKGVGTIGMEFAFDVTRSLGKTVMRLWALAENTSSITFCEPVDL